MKKDRTPEEIHTLILGAFGTEIGQRCLEYLTDVFIDRDVYRKGLTFEEVAFREGQRDVIRQLINELNKG